MLKALKDITLSNFYRPSFWKGVLPTYAKQGFVVFTGDIIAKVMTFSISILLLKLISIEEIGYYGVFLSILAVVNQFTDLGLHQGVVRFYSLHNQTDAARSQSFIWLAFRCKWFIIPITSVILYFAAPWISMLLVHNDALEHGLRLLSLGLFGTGFFEFSISVLQARQNFKLLTGLRITEAFAKLTYLLVTIYLGVFSLEQVFISYTIIPLFVGTLGLFTSRVFSARIKYPWKELFAELYHFTKWLAVTYMAIMILQHVDMFMVSGLITDNSVDVGLYSAARRLSIPLVVMAGSLTTLFFPKAMGITSHEQMLVYVKQTLKISIPVSVVSLTYLGVLHLVIPWFFVNITGSLPIINWLFAGYIFTILGNPVTILITAMGDTKVVAMINIIQFIVTLILHYVFITQLGSIGAAISSFIIWVIAGTFSFWYIYNNQFKFDHLIKQEN